MTQNAISLRACALVVILVVCLLMGIQHPPAQGAPEPQHEPAFRVIGYLPDYRLAGIDSGQLRHITDLIYVSLEPLATGDLNTKALGPDVLRKLHEMIGARPVRLLVAVGGWLRSGGYGPMVTHPEARRRFVENLTRFCLANKLNGVEFDWEGPGNPQEEAGYAALMQETKQSFAPHQLRVTVAQAAWDNLSKAGLEAVDEVHIMAYDHDGKHSTMPDAENDVHSFIAKGVPKHKLYMGLPFYGRNIHNRNQDMTYADIVAKFHPTPATDLADDIYFNNIDTIRQKTAWARGEGLGGVMAWEIGQDTTDDTSLLQAVSRAAKR
jgi:chitinase